MQKGDLNIFVAGLCFASTCFSAAFGDIMLTFTGFTLFMVSMMWACDARRG